MTAYTTMSSVQSEYLTSFSSERLYLCSKLLIWIFNNEKKSPRVFTSICNLVYGNTLVLSSQVTRLLCETIDKMFQFLGF